MGNKKVLTIPVHSEVDHEAKQTKVQPILARAAQTLVASGLLYRWTKYTGLARLSLWNDRERMFQFLGLDDFICWLGQHYRIIDSDGVEWAGPSPVVGDRLYAAVLNHPDIQLASFGLQEERRREKK